MPGFEDLAPGAWPWEQAEVKRGQPLAAPFERAKWSRSRLVIAGEHGGERLYLKRHKPYRLRSKLSGLILGPKLRREWEVSRLFLEIGLMVPQPVFYAAAGGGVHYLATRALPPEWRSLEDLCAAEGTEAAPLLDLARATRALHDRKAYHDDYRTDHVFVRSMEPGLAPEERFAWIDLDGARVGRVPTRRQRREAFFELFLSLHRVEFPRRLAVAMGHAYDPGGDFRLDHGRIWEEAARHFQELRVIQRAHKAKQAARRQGSG